MPPRLLVSLLSLRRASTSGVAFVRAAVPEVLTAYAARGGGEALVQCDAATRDLLAGVPAAFDVRPARPSRVGRNLDLRQHLPQAVRSFRPDVLYVPDMPVIGAPVETRTVVVVHSHLNLTWPTVDGAARFLYWKLWWNRRFRADLGRAAAVLAPTQAFASELAALVRIRPERLHVVLHGVGPEYAPGPRAAAPERPYVLAVSNAVAYKNLVGTLRIFATAAEGLPHELHVAGVDRRGLSSAWAASGLPASLAARVRPLGRLEGPALVDQYRGAAALLFPTFVESFGLPVLEALATGTPVACSGLASLREVAAGAAIHGDPAHEPAFAALLRGLLQDAALCARLRQAGLRRAAELSWQRTGQTTARVLLDVATARPA